MISYYINSRNIYIYNTRGYTHTNAPTILKRRQAGGVSARTKIESKLFREKVQVSVSDGSRVGSVVGDKNEGLFVLLHN